MTDVEALTAAHHGRLVTSPVYMILTKLFYPDLLAFNYLKPSKCTSTDAVFNICHLGGAMSPCHFISQNTIYPPHRVPSINS